MLARSVLCSAIGHADGRSKPFPADVRVHGAVIVRHERIPDGTYAGGAFHPFVVIGLGRRQHRLKRASVLASFSCRVVQFVRSLSPSTSYAPAVVGLASKYGWKRVCLLVSVSDETSPSWTSALVNKNVNVLKKQIVGSISDVLAEIADERLRVVLVLAPPVYVRNVAVAADSLQLIRTGWAWITDSAAQKIDFTGDAPDVREILTSVSCPA